MSRKGRITLLIVSLILLAFGIAILHANRAERSRSIADELIETTEVLPENEGKLVIVSGTPQLPEDELIVDKETGMQLKKAVYYSRVPYQKVYVREKRTVVVDQGKDKLSTDDDVKKTEYYVVQDWIHADQERDAVVSDGSKRYENPDAIDLSACYASADLRIADFRISPYDVSDCIQTKKGGFPQEVLKRECAEYIQNSAINLQTVADENGYGMLSNGDEIGAVHVRFSYETLERAEPATVIGRQRGDRIVFEEDDLVSEAERVQHGTVSREAFLSSVTSEDTTSRKYGIGCLVLGAILFLSSLNWTQWFRSKRAE